MHSKSKRKQHGCDSQNAKQSAKPSAAHLASIPSKRYEQSYGRPATPSGQAPSARCWVLDGEQVNDHPQQMAEYLADGSVPHALYDGQSLGDQNLKNSHSPIRASR